MLRMLGEQGLVVAGKLKDEAVWGLPETYSFNQKFCVYGRDNELLFCPDKQLGSRLQSIKSQWKETTTGNTEWGTRRENVLVGFWRLFLKPNFHYPAFTIVVASDRQLALEGVSELRDVFAIISFLTLVIVAFFSTFQIRRYLVPVEELMNGIRRISNNDFKTHVNVETDDEFQQLGDSFNLMSTKISKQFDFLTTLSEIDQLILSNRDNKDVLLFMAAQGRKLFQSDMISLAKVDENEGVQLKLYAEDSDHSYGVAVTSSEISTIEKDELKNKKTVLIRANNNEEVPDYLKSLVKNPASSLVLVPILSADELVAILIFGFPYPAVEQEVHVQLRELGDRFAIALEKSVWEKKLYVQAHYDPLTQLPNRQLLNDRLEQAIKRATRDGTCFSLMFLDLDRFKTINDSLGHSSGDKLLKMVSQRLTNTLREEDTIARLGGDEFIIFLPETKSQGELYSQSQLIAEKTLLAITAPYLVNNQEIHMSGSIGIASFPADGYDLEGLVKNADAAMYLAKAEGGNNAKFYSKELSEKALQQLVMETSLHRALKNKEFQLFYQAKVEASTGKVVGTEALIRWIHPVEGMISPDKFISLAEKTGLIKELGGWVVNEACQQNKKWQNEGLPKVSVSVNFSPRQFKQAGLVEMVESSLVATGLSPNWLDIEIIEGTAMDDIERAILVLQKFKDLGVSISIDDYGTGYSSLSYIKKFPVDNLKIDRSFIQNLDNDEGDQAIVASTITLANKLGLKVVAEGVEKIEQLTWLQNAGCDEIQGYYFSPPLPASEFAKLLKKEVFEL